MSGAGSTSSPDHDDDAAIGHPAQQVADERERVARFGVEAGLLLDRAQQRLEVRLARPRRAVPDATAAAGHESDGVAVPQRQVAERARDQDRHIPFRSAALGRGRHAPAGVDGQDDVLPPGLLVALDEGGAGAGGGLPVDVVDLVAGDVLAQVVEVEAATRGDGGVLALEQVRGTPVRVDEQT